LYFREKLLLWVHTKSGCGASTSERGYDVPAADQTYPALPTTHPGSQPAERCDRYTYVGFALATHPAGTTIDAERISVVTRTAARLSIYRPEDGAVLAWTLCNGAG